MTTKPKYIIQAENSMGGVSPLHRYTSKGVSKSPVTYKTLADAEEALERIQRNLPSARIVAAS